MREVKADYPFFEYFEKHFSWQKRNFVKTKLPSKDILPKKVRHPTHEVEKPVSPSPKVNVLEAYLSSSSSNEPSSDKEIDPLEDYEPLLYCGFCNLFDRYHEHGHDNDPPAFDPYEGYPSGYDTD